MSGVRERFIISVYTRFGGGRPRRSVRSTGASGENHLKPEQVPDAVANLQRAHLTTALCVLICAAVVLCSAALRSTIGRQFERRQRRRRTEHACVHASFSGRSMIFRPALRLSRPDPPRWRTTSAPSPRRRRYGWIGLVDWTWPCAVVLHAT